MTLKYKNYSLFSFLKAIKVLIKINVKQDPIALTPFWTCDSDFVWNVSIYAFIFSSKFSMIIIN